MHTFFLTEDQYEGIKKRLKLESYGDTTDEEVDDQIDVLIDEYINN